MTKTVFITGGSTGIGWELAKLYAQDGYTVGICARDKKKLPADFDDAYPQIRFYPCDVTQKLALQECIKKFAQEQSYLDIMIANAGLSTGSKQQVPDYLTVENIIDTNVKGMLYAFDIATQIFLKQKRGHLVAMGSVAGLVGLPGAAAYSASKAAVLTFCESLAIDLPKYGIDVTAIAPGFIDTPLTQKNDHKMPFIMPASKGAHLIKKAIEQRKSLYIFPRRMHWFIGIARLLPRAIYRWMMRQPCFNYSRGL
jgi:short-subunit dehydrogenase